MKELLQHRVTARAAAAPEAVAVVDGGGHLTYGSLESDSNRLARLLTAAGCGRGDRVGILLPKQPTAIVAMLAALKADAVYVPLDPAEPPARLARLLQAADCRCLLVASRAGAALRAVVEQGLLAPLRFDLSTFDVFGTLRAGAELRLVPSELNLQPGRLAQFLRESRITRWLSVPSTLGLMARFNAVAPGDFPELRDLMFAGEVLTVPTLAHWMRRLPPPGDGEELMILDGRRRPVPDGRIDDSRPAAPLP